MVASEPQKSRSAEFLDEAKDEDEEAFLEAMAAAAEMARSPDAIAALREAGQAAAAALKSDTPATVADALAAKGKTKPTNKVFKALKKPKGTMALVGEGITMDTVTLGGFDLHDPAYLSEQYRDGGCAAVMVRTDFDDDLCADALAKTVQEQECARGQFPSPVPAIARAPFVDEIQLAAAAAGGAKAVMLPLAVNGAEQTAELMAGAEALGLEVLLRVCTDEELAAAAALKPTMIAIGDVDFEAADALRAALPEGVVSVADLPFPDVRGAWKVRDMGFNALIAGRSMLDVCVRDRVPPASIIKAVLSKGSVKFGLGYQKGRLEGAKEFLGSIAM